MDNLERTMKTDKIYEGKILSLKVETVELPNKKYSKRELIEHDPAVAILAVNNQGEIILVDQYRKAVDKVLCEVPAGLIEYGESPKEAALRELEEETGFKAGKIEYVTEFYTSPGFCNEKIYIFFAKDLEKTEKNLDDDEFIESKTVAFDKAVEMVMRGEIMDAKTISAVLLYKEMVTGNANR
nr:NUDIX hydrolase [Peptoniphilus catoniae]